MFGMKKIKNIPNIKKAKSKIRKLAEALDVLINDGVIFDKISEAKKNFDPAFCDYHEECKTKHNDCQKCHYLEGQLTEIDNYVLEAKDSLEEAAKEIDKIVKRIQKKKKNKKT